MLIIVFGVSGSGKSTIAKLLAKELNLAYYDADDFHPEANIRKMKNGIALNDDDRQPWLMNLSEKLLVWQQENGAVLACSALKETYRNILSSKTNQIKWVFLNGSYETIKHRVDAREGHFMNTSLLKSQFETLEIPEYAVDISIDDTPSNIIKTITQSI